MTLFDPHLFNDADIPRTIQLATAPVFFLAGIGAFMNVITGRLARVVDRARELERAVVALDRNERRRHVDELRVLEQRMSLASRSIFVCTASALTVCLLVITMFAEELINFNLSRLVALLFVLAVALLAGGMVLFLAETRIAVKALHVREELIEWGEDEARR